MELALNLGWVLVAVWMFCAWLRIAPHAAKDRRIQLVALAVVILILLPAISMTDDLVAAQNPAETDTCARRDYDFSCPHSIVPITLALPLPAFASLPASVEQMPALRQNSTPRVEVPSLASIQNRPPPAA